MITSPKAAEKAPRPLRVLLVEDSEPDAILLARALERGGFAPDCHRVDTAQAMDAALRHRALDLVLADHSMPHFSAPEALELLKRQGQDIPFIIVSGHIDEETAIAAMRAGAQDYVMKDRLARLVPVVERELREAEVRRARTRYEEELRRAHEELETRVEKRTAALKTANHQLERVIEERRRLENELLEIAENERRRIGFDLHDDLGQKLTGLSLMVKGLEHRLSQEGHAGAEEASRIHALINELIHHTHNLAHEFSSLDLRGDDLSLVLKGLADSVKKMFDLPCGFNVRGHIPELPKNTTLQLYKIAQEAISNAIKHGKASKVCIELIRNGGILLLTIKNDGVSFNTAKAPSNRMGLRIMNYRASTVGASLDIKPASSSGTVVSCTLPLQNGAKESSKTLSSATT